MNAAEPSAPPPLGNVNRGKLYIVGWQTWSDMTLLASELALSNSALAEGKSPFRGWGLGARRVNIYMFHILS